MPYWKTNDSSTAPLGSRFNNPVGLEDTGVDMLDDEDENDHNWQSEDAPTDINWYSISTQEQQLLLANHAEALGRLAQQLFKNLNGLEQCNEKTKKWTAFLTFNDTLNPETPSGAHKIPTMFQTIHNVD